MSELRRRMMMKLAGTPLINGYISDGLILYLDGIDKGSVAERWKDLINGVEFYPVGSGVSFRENGVYLNNTSAYSSGINSYLKMDGTYQKPYLDYTLEFVYQGNQGPSGTFYFFDNGNDYPALIARSGRIFSTYAGDNPTQRVSIANTTFKTISMTKNDVVVDLVPKTTSVSSHDHLKNTKLTIGASSQWYYAFTGLIHSLRIYSRNLSIDEMLYNQSVDNERFNLGL